MFLIIRWRKEISSICKYFIRHGNWINLVCRQENSRSSLNKTPKATNSPNSIMFTTSSCAHWQSNLSQTAVGTQLEIGKISIVRIERDSSALRRFLERNILDCSSSTWKIYLNLCASRGRIGEIKVWLTAWIIKADCNPTKKSKSPFPSSSVSGIN